MADLISAARREGLEEHQPDLAMDVIASRCNVNRSTVYDLLNGSADPLLIRDWTIIRMSKGLNQEPHIIRAAILKSRELAEKKAASTEEAATPKRGRKRAAD